MAAINPRTPVECRCSQVHYTHGEAAPNPLQQAQALNTEDLGGDTLVFVGKTPCSLALLVLVLRQRPARDESYVL